MEKEVRGFLKLDCDTLRFESWGYLLFKSHKHSSETKNLVRQRFLETGARSDNVGSRQSLMLISLESQDETPPNAHLKMNSERMSCCYQAGAEQETRIAPDLRGRDRTRIPASLQGRGRTRTPVDLQGRSRKRISC